MNVSYNLHLIVHLGDTLYCFISSLMRGRIPRQHSASAVALSLNRSCNLTPCLISEGKCLGRFRNELLIGASLNEYIKFVELVTKVRPFIIIASITALSCLIPTLRTPTSLQTVIDTSWHDQLVFWILEAALASIQPTRHLLPIMAHTEV